jgi:SAM-dependent methyltransferase
MMNMPICEICGHKKFSLITTRIREGEGRIVKCDNCNLVAQDLGWDEKKLRDYYEKDYQSTNSLVTGESQSPEEHFTDRMKTIDSVFAKIKPLLKPDSRILEVGCGAGELLSLIKPIVKHCVGVELNTPFVGFIKSELGIDAYAEDVNKLKLDEKFDLIISISTLDHMPNPLAALVSMKKMLAPGGKVYVEVPNIDEALNHLLPQATRAKYNEFFWHRAHLFYFSKDTISALFKKAGLKSEVSCRHEYTLKNFLNWYFLGKPQSDFVTGLTDTGLFQGKSDFEKEMNDMFFRIEKEFKDSMSRTFSGDNLCCLGEEL